MTRNPARCDSATTATATATESGGVLTTVIDDHFDRIYRANEQALGTPTNTSFSGSATIALQPLLAGDVPKLILHGKGEIDKRREFCFTSSH